MKPNPLANLKPINKSVAEHMKKDIAMASVATQFIGKSCAAYNVPSSTRNYMMAWKELGLANTGVYSESDIIMVSGSGLWRGVTQEKIDETFNKFYLPLLKAAISAKVKGFVVGHAKGMDYIVSQYLLLRGYLEVKSKGFSAFKRPKYGEIKVVNKKTLISEIGWEDIYVGRPSDLGNPYPISKTVTREESILAFSNWIEDKIRYTLNNYDNASKEFLALCKIARKVKSGENIRLVCFCVPENCHANVIKNKIYWLIYNYPNLVDEE